MVAIRACLVVLIGCVLACPGVAVAQADTGPCTPEEDSPSCEFAYGTVMFVADGDTIDVDIPGVGIRRVRLTGINATEQTTYSKAPARRRGACHALEATERLERLIEKGGGEVRLAAQNLESMAGRRLRRQVSVRIQGSWVDTGRELVADGLALWLPHGIEYAWNRSYKQLSEQAAARRLNLFDSDACGPGPAPDVQPNLELEWDARGNDGRNTNGEWAEIKNPSTQPLPLEGWWFRDSSARRFTFPPGAVVPAEDSIRLHVGRGNSDEADYFWGLPGPAFENASGGRRAMGDGGYLFDPRGNLRAWHIYPGADDNLVSLRPRKAIQGIVVITVLVLLVGGLIRQRG